MNRLIITLIFIGLLSCSSKEYNNSSFIIRQENNNIKKDLPCKTMTSNNWVTFDSTTTKDFSESFKKKLSEKLSEKLCGLLGNKISNSTFDFHLNIGSPVYQLNENNSLITKPFEITNKEGYAFANVGLTTVFAQLHNVSVAWSSSEFKDPLDIHKNDVTNKQIDFFWCNDFPKDEIITSLAPTKTKSKLESGYKFDILYFLKVFPDVTIYFEFKENPSKETLDEIQLEVNKFRDKFKTVFVHDMTKYNGHYTISINHNTIDYNTYTEKDFEKDVNNFDFLLKNLDSNSKIVGLTQITFQ